MLSRLKIRDFQSLENLDLELKPFTVIVGPSSSGKSAVVRALKLLVSNARGTDYVRRGTQSASVEVETVDSAMDGIAEHMVKISRGALNVYDVAWDMGPIERYTKLGGDVPQHVTDALKIPPGDQPNFASQFDSPFLLTSTGSKTAQTLGELTNISIVLEAARESNRRRTETVRQIGTAKTQLSQVQARIPEFANLPQRKQQLDRAAELVQEARELELRVGKIATIIQTLGVCSVALRQPLPSSPPDITDAVKLSDLIAQVRTLLADIEAAKTRVSQLEQQIQAADRAAFDAVGQFQTALAAAGVCPLCGQSTKETHSHVQS